MIGLRAYRCRKPTTQRSLFKGMSHKLGEYTMARHHRRGGRSEELRIILPGGFMLLMGMDGPVPAYNSTTKARL